MLPNVARADGTAPPVRLRGVVKERGTRRPIGGAQLAVLVGGEVIAEAESDATGSFACAIAPSVVGQVQVTVGASGYKPLSLSEDLSGGAALTVDYRLEPDRYSRYTSTVRSSDPAREEVARERVSTEEIAKTPGTRGDALRALESLPGVARAPFGSGQLVLWGSAPGDSAVLVNGHTIPQLYHLGGVAFSGGLTSVIPTELIESIDFMPGNFGVRYGRATGGAVDVTTRTPSRDGYHGYAKLDFIDVAAMVEGPVGKGSFALALRRSTIDFAIAIAHSVAGIDLQFTTAPRYWDYQAMLDYPLLGGKLKLIIFGSDDAVDLLIANSPDQDPDVRGRFDTHGYFHTLNASYTRDFGPVTVALSSSVGPQHSELGLGQTVGFNLDVVEWDWRLEARWRVMRRFWIRAGMDLAFDWFQTHVMAPYSATESQVQPPITVLKKTTFDEGGWEANPGFYVEGHLGLGARLSLVPGMRIDHFQGQRWTFDPRLGARLEVAPRTTLVGGVGLYHQPSPAPYSDPFLGNPTLRPQEAIHLSLGVESSPFARLRELRVKLMGFYKQLWNLPAPSTDLVQRGGKVVPEIYSDAGVGRVYGLELLVRQDLSRYVWGWISYTLMKSERQDQPGGPWRPFVWDQTHILAIVLSAHLPLAFDVGVRFRYVTGNPETPIPGGVYFSDYDAYVPLSGAPYSTRDPDFIQLDVRVDKKFTFRSWWLDVYVDVSDVTYRKNVEGYADSYDYAPRYRVPVTGLPILPSLGIKAAF
jgi:outer membrane receptor protein involved in Fe transport